MTDARFDTLGKRRENEDELSEILEQALQAKTAKEWEQLFFEAGVPAGKVNTVEEAFMHPQAQARNMLISFDHPLGKKMKCAGNPLKFSATKVREYKPAPGIGEHTQEVLSNLLDYSSAKIAKLREEGVIWYPYRGVTYGSGAMARF
jgi:crotonobetainyl-CoA:carnitine CoA-transferase CaiB-like acyl-CoA transferase